MLAERNLLVLLQLVEQFVMAANPEPEPIVAYGVAALGGTLA